MPPSTRVFFDVSVGGKNAGRLIFELFANELPLTSENFRCLCTGETGLGYYFRPRWYKSTSIYRVIPKFMCQGGDYNKSNGYGGESIYGQFFRDEKFLYNHSKRGVLSMAKSHIKHTNSSEFFITFGACPWLDSKHVVFGQVESGMDVLDAIEAVGAECGFPSRPIRIFDCGELKPSFFVKGAADLYPELKDTTGSSNATERPEINKKWAYVEEQTVLPKHIFKRSKYNF